MISYDVNIVHKNYIYSDVQDFMLYESMKSVACMFSFKMYNTGKYDFMPEDIIKIRFNNKVFLIGHIEKIDTVRNSKSRFIKISGRNLLSSIVDCNPVNNREYNNISIVELSKKICGPFGINVKSNVPSDYYFNKYSSGISESCFLVLSKAARKAGGIFYSDRESNLIFDKVGEKNLNLSLTDEDILGYYRKQDATDIYKDISVKSQNINGNLEVNVDGGSKRFRPMTIIGSASTEKECKTIGEWDNLNRMQLSDKREIKLFGWQIKKGVYWSVNNLINLDCTEEKGTFLITDVMFIKNEKNINTILSLENVSNYKVS